MPTKFATIGTYIRLKRAEKRLTQDEVATLLGYDQKQNVSNWERGVSHPPFKVLSTLCRVLDLDKEVLVKLFTEIAHEDIKRRIYTTKQAKRLRLG
jgi:transcriptional regulator with XRE-family HTH domain